MKAKLMGIQHVDFIPVKDGIEQPRVTGDKLHVVAEMKESGIGMTGQRVASVFVRQGAVDVPSLKLGGIVDLVYDQPLGTNKSRLVAVQNVG